MTRPSESAFSTAINPVDGKVAAVPTHAEVNEKIMVLSAETPHEVDKEATEIKVGPASESDDLNDDDEANSSAIIVTGADAALHLLSIRDDHDTALTFRSFFLATVLSAFQAVLTQIYNWKPSSVSVQGTFIVLIGYFLGEAWANFLPRGDRLEARWRQRGGTGTRPTWIAVIAFFNDGPWSLKEHAVCSITATSASNVTVASLVFAAQDIFYNLSLSPVTVILATISIGLFGYGLAGLMRPFAVWDVEAVYWGTLPTVKVLQGLHWQKVKNSKPLRYFWYAFTGMFTYEFFPAYMFPWLNSISIPCLASMRATGSTGATLTNLFGGSLTNEGLGLFSLSLDWQYLTSYQTSLPLKFQLHQAVGLFICFIVMIGIYYTNAWDSKSLPFMSTQLLTNNGTIYPISEVFSGGILNTTALEENGLPSLSGSFAYSMLMANAAIGALITHCILFWGGDVKRAFKGAKSGKFADRHHTYMAANYKETPWLWYVAVLVISFVLGVIVVTREDVTLPFWGYLVSLLLGILIAPFSTLLYSRYGNGIATNNFSSMMAGLMLPGRPVGNLYFNAWSHTVIANALNLCNDLKLGEYLKIPPRVMFLTQIWGTVFGAFINYAVMISIVKDNKQLLLDGNGDSSWSGAQIQAYDTNAAAWSLAKYLYSAGTRYQMVPLGLVIGAGAVAIHRAFFYFVPRIHGVSVEELNLAQLIQFAGYIPYNQPLTCVIMTWIIGGFTCQYYIRNYHPRIFKDYMYLVTGAFDGASLTALFILSFAVFGAGGPSVPFPYWWGNNIKGNYDFCPTT